MNAFPSLIEIGRRVSYSGDMANHPGDGVIVARSGNSFDVALFDGRLWRGVSERQLCDRGSRFRLRDRLHGPAVIAMAQRKHAEREAERVLAKARAEHEHAKAIDALRAEHPQLQEIGRHARVAAVAKNVRAALKAAGLKARVRSESFSGGTAITVTLPSDADAETLSQAEVVAHRFQEGHFNGMEDIYEYERSAWCDLFGGTKYVHVNRGGLES